MLSVFVLSRMVHDHPCGQEAALQGSLVSICLEQLNDPSPLLRQWLAIALANLWSNYDKARWTGVRDSAHEKLYVLLKDPVPEVSYINYVYLFIYLATILLIIQLSF